MSLRNDFVFRCFVILLLLTCKEIWKFSITIFDSSYSLNFVRNKFLIFAKYFFKFVLSSSPFSFRFFLCCHWAGLRIVCQILVNF